jgi:hypothetical protein
MKKVLLSLAVACIATVQGVNAQVIISENFDAPTTIPALPSAWTQGSTGTPGWKTATFPVANWGSATGTTLPTHASQIGLLDDWNDSLTTNLHDTLKSPIFSLAGTTSAWLNFDYYYYNATKSSSGATEKALVVGSTDGGATWTSLGDITGTAWDEIWSTGHFSLASLGTGTNVRVGIVYTDAGDHIIGIALDNISVVNLNTSSAGVTALDYNSVTNGISANGQPVSFTLENSGIPISSFDANFTINGGTPITQSFTGVSVLPYASQNFTFTSTIAGAVAGTNTLTVTITNVNTVANTDPAASRTSNFILASATTQRQGLIEEFSSSTCPPCKSFNDMYDPLCLSLGMNTSGTNINVIKYQMNWPSPGTDRSYNSDGLARRTYYGVNSIPDHFVNGVVSSATDYTAEANSSKANSAFIDMAVTYNVDTVAKKLGVILTVTPHFTKTGSYHVYTAVMDKFYQNTTNTTGQLKYYHVMRKMLPSGSGHAVSSWTDGVAQTFSDSVIFTSGDYTAGTSSYPTQNSFKFWNNVLTGSEVVAFVQEDGNKSIMQSIQTLPAGLINVSTLAKIDGIEIFPNPTKGLANLKFNLQEAGNVRVAIMDYTGKLVSEVTNRNMSLGMQNVAITTTGIAPGNYIVLLSTEGGNRAERLTVE